MTIAYSANDLQLIFGGRFILGLGTQVKAHIEQRFNMAWSKPAVRMREYVLTVRAIWESWESWESWEKGTPLQFNGEFY